MSPRVWRGWSQIGVTVAIAFVLAWSAVGAPATEAREPNDDSLDRDVMVASAQAGSSAARQESENGIIGPAQPGERVGPSVAVTPGSGWQEFSFFSPGVPARGCAPADPIAPFCSPSSAGNSSFAGAPPWTFTGPATLIVTDAFTAGDVFQIFDFNQFVGTTSAPTSGTNCGSNPDTCLATAGMSHGTFNLGAGSHSITIVPQSVATPGTGGVGYFRVNAGGGGPTTCTLTQTVTRSGSTLTLTYGFTVTDAATWAVIVIIGPAAIPIIVTPITASTPAPAPITIPNVPSLGTIGWLTTISTPTQGIICSDFDLIAT